MVHTQYSASMRVKAEIYDDFVMKYKSAIKECETNYRKFINLDESFEKDYAYSDYLKAAAEIEIVAEILRTLNPDCDDFINPSWVVDGIVERVSQE